MNKNNVPAGETRSVIVTFLVQGGTDSGIAYQRMPAELVNEMDDLIERMTKYSKTIAKEN